MLYKSRLLLVDKPMHAKHSGKLLLLLSELTDPKLLFAIFRHYLAQYFFLFISHKIPIWVFKVV